MKNIFELTIYEIRKLFSIKSLKVIFLLLISANVIVCSIFSYSLSKNKIPFHIIEPVYNLMQEDPERFFAEKDRLTIQSYDTNIPQDSQYGNGKYSDLYLFNEVLNISNSDSIYKKEIKNLIFQSQQILNSLETSTLSEDAYTKDYQKAIITIYSDAVENVEIKNAPIYGWDCYFSYSYDFIFTIISLVIFTAFLFQEDKNNNFIFIGITTKYGRITTAISKLAVSVLFSFVFTTLFTLSNLLVIALSQGFSNYQEAIQAIDFLKYVPFRFSIIKYVWINFLCKLSSVVFLTLIFSIFSLFWGNVLYYAASGCFVIFQNWILNFPSITVGQWIYLNIFSLSNPTGILSRYRSLNIFNHSVNIITFLLISLPIILSLLGIFVILTYHKTKLRKLSHKIHIPSSRKFYNKSNKSKKYSSSLINHEIIKHIPIYVILTICIITKILSSYQYYYPIESSYERMKNEYMAILNGPYSFEKESYIENKIKLHTTTVSQYDTMKYKFLTGEISEEDYSYYISEYTTAQGELPLLYDLLDYSQYLKQTPNGWYIYDTGITKLLTRTPDYLLIIGIMLFSGMVYVEEFRYKTSQFPIINILSTTKKGRKTLFYSKLSLSVLISLIIYILFSLIDILCIVYFYPSTSVFAPICSIQHVGISLGNISIIKHLSFVYSIGLFGTCIISVLCVNLSYLLRKPHLILIVSCLILLSPIILSSILYVPLIFMSPICIIDINYFSYILISNRLDIPFLIIIPLIGMFLSCSSIFSTITIKNQ